MKASEHVRNRAESLDHSNFKRVKSEYLGIHHDISGLRFLRDRAARERDMRELYRGRAPYELLQNADDAGATRVVYILMKEGLAFAHDGRWFTVDNFKSLADGWSDKDPGKCIGHKGIGFRSVLDITPAPYIVRVGTAGFFAIKFTWALNHGHIQETLRRNPSLVTEYEKWTAHGQLACPIMSTPGQARKHNLGRGAVIFDRLLRGTYNGDYTTLFWFPARDEDIDRKVFQELGPVALTSDGRGHQLLLDFMKDEVSVLLPFLASVKEVRLYVDEDCIAWSRLAVASSNEQYGQVTVHAEIGKEALVGSFFQMRCAFRIPPSILGDPETPKAVKAMGNAKVVMSVSLVDGQPICNEQSYFHVYFPTEEKASLGFIVHGDFFVKPDRTRLMEGKYNEWLLGEIARIVANEFLTRLLQQYQPRSVFAALSPVERASTKSAQDLGSLLSAELQQRPAPFVPTSAGLVRQAEAILPSTIDQDGFWETHFSDVVADVVEGKKAFLRHDVDGERTRAFLGLADVLTLDPEALLTFIEVASQQLQSASWWYECYTYMAYDSQLSRQDHSFFAGRRLIPTASSAVIDVTGEDDERVVCLPPGRDISSLAVPRVFSSVFVFLDLDLAQLLQGAKDTIQSWVLSRLGISRFEATDLLPRAIRGVGPKLFSGGLSVTAAELRQAWIFIKRVVDSSRIDSPSFWQGLGRFPLPIGSAASGEQTLDPTRLVPAFLAYLPESFSREDKSLVGIPGLRRIDAMFLGDLITESGKRRQDWVDFLKMIGVSTSPKLLTYRRLAVGGHDILFNSDLSDEPGDPGFSGERQNDENRAVLHILKGEKLWASLVRESALCDHDVPKVLQSLPILEGLELCVQAAQAEYEAGKAVWSQRLWALVGALPSPAQGQENAIFCRGGRPGGHSIAIDSYLQKQLEHHRWLPTSQGPATSSECFGRLGTRRLVSSGRLDEELGDLLLPYVVADSIDTLARLEALGIESLDDAASASTEALIRALGILGERLSTEWGQQEIIAVRSRWRLVRGAIQEIYRALNQRKEAFSRSSGIRLAARSGDGIVFRCTPLYYAEPGSSLEQAFVGILPLIDADRSYPVLFERFGVIRLDSGSTVREIFVAETHAVPAVRLHKEVTEHLAPYLLAPMIAKADKPAQSESEKLLRRLKERFEVRAADHLTVSYALVSDPSVERTVEFPLFYLQRRVVPGPGAIQEAYYTLYVAGTPSVSLFAPGLDADALGAALIPMFVNEMGEELAGLFPRIASRFYHRRGSPEDMAEFLHRQLGVSRAAQDAARATVAGETPEEHIPMPPPARIVNTTLNEKRTMLDAQSNVIRQVHDSQSEFETLLREVIAPSQDDTSAQKPSIDSPRLQPPRVSPVTDEQKQRGRTGEEEAKRRLCFPGGWEGFTLLKDTREDGCGYDFLCMIDGREVMLEVKSFTRNGQVYVTTTELQAAAANQDAYYLVGLLDDGNPPQQWKAYIARNPAVLVLAKGSPQIQMELKASAVDIFDLEHEGM